MQRSCPECGHPQPADSEFCASCEAYLGWSGDEDQGVVEEPTREVAQTTRIATVPATAAGSSAADPAPRGVQHCLRCGAENAPELRFCRRCGQLLSATPAAGRGTSAEPPPWWRRWLPGGGTSREARSAYRSSLPLRYRVVRVLGLALLVLAAVGAWTAWQHDPVQWVRQQWYALRGTLVEVSVDEARASTQPPDVDAASASLAVDERPGDAWSTAWPADTPDVELAAEACADVPRGTATLVLPLQQVSTVRGLDAATQITLSGGDRMPRVVQLQVGDACRQVELDESGEQQRVTFDDPLEGDLVRVSVLAAYPPAAAQARPQRVFLGEVRLLQRPD